MTMSPEHIDLHRMVDRLDPDQVRALRAGRVAQLTRVLASTRDADRTAPRPPDGTATATPP